MKQGFAWWSFAEGRDPSPDLLKAAADIGYQGVDFLPPEMWPLARELGLKILIIDGHVPLEIGFNDRANHDDLRDQVRQAIETAKTEDIPFVAVASGDRAPDSDADGMAACVEGLAPLAGEAAEAGLCLLLEPLNSKIDHPNHECDLTAWAVALVDRVDSPGLRILYDFYHAQIMEGDLLRTVEANFSRIAHFHTAGVPGRHDLDDTQEINWRAIARWLNRIGFSGYVTHELIPRSDPVDALRQAYDIFAIEASDRSSLSRSG